MGLIFQAPCLACADRRNVARHKVVAALDLDSGVHTGWTRTGYRFSVIKRGSSYAGTMPMCRFWSGMLSSHFYTAKPSECEDVKVMFAHA